MSGAPSGFDRTLNFLLIDDDDVCLFIHRRVLELTSYCNATISVKKAEKAIEMLRNASSKDTSFPDVILLDLEMPGMNGIAFLKALRELPFDTRRIAVVLVTSSVCERDKQHALSLGVVQCLSKPLLEEELTPVIHLLFSAVHSPRRTLSTPKT